MTPLLQKAVVEIVCVSNLHLVLVQRSCLVFQNWMVGRVSTFIISQAGMTTLQRCHESRTDSPGSCKDSPEWSPPPPERYATCAVQVYSITPAHDRVIQLSVIHNASWCRVFIFIFPVITSVLSLVSRHPPQRLRPSDLPSFCRFVRLSVLIWVSQVLCLAQTCSRACPAVHLLHSM